MELVLHVTRDEQSRLSGTVCASRESGPHEFSGVLELLRVFEELVPPESVALAGDGVELPTPEAAE